MKNLRKIVLTTGALIQVTAVFAQEPATIVITGSGKNTYTLRPHLLKNVRGKIDNRTKSLKFSADVPTDKGGQPLFYIDACDVQIENLKPLRLVGGSRNKCPNFDFKGTTIYLP
jgi:hypothetical protein